ncbi:hypothetical protein [Cytobacillus horneckiae]|uniref:hypothetical protein n=1 Tax=Cytobacillus horneckiae TaxID=549687 RepID=UPI003D202041
MPVLKWYEKLIVHAAILAVTIFLGVTVWLMVDMGYDSAAISTGLIYFTGLIIALTEMNKLNESEK